MKNQILIAYIDPTYKKAISINEFSGVAEFIEAPCMLVRSEGFIMGSTESQFTVFWGEPEFETVVENGEEIENIVAFKRIAEQNVVLTGSAIENWGTEDSEILYAVAAKLGTTVSQIVTANIRF
jgi:hypothetical protein